VLYSLLAIVLYGKGESFGKGRKRETGEQRGWFITLKVPRLIVRGACPVGGSPRQTGPRVQQLTFDDGVPTRLQRFSRGNCCRGRCRRKSRRKTKKEGRTEEKGESIRISGTSRRNYKNVFSTGLKYLSCNPENRVGGKRRNGPQADHPEGKEMDNITHPSF